MLKEQGGATNAPQDTLITSPTVQENNSTSRLINVVSPSEKPKIIVKYEYIPQSLKNIKKWMNWGYGTYDEKKGKWNKVPTISGWNKQENLLSFDEAKKISEFSNNTIGIGIATLNSNFTCFDLDELSSDEELKRKDKDGTLGFKTLLNNTADYYIEKSVSGNGLHIIFLDPEHKFISRLSSNPIKCDGCDHIEIFCGDKDRFIAITGDAPTKRVIELNAISNPEVENIKSWINEKDGVKSTISTTVNKIVTKPLKSIVFTPECLPACITCVIERLKSKKGVDHEKRILLASFMFNIGLNISDVFEYFKDSEDFNQDETMKQLLSVEKKIKETGGYNYACKTISKWVNKDDDTPVCDHKCPVETFPREAYVTCVMNKEMGIVATQPDFTITEDDLNKMDNTEFTKPFEFGLHNSLIGDYIEFQSTQSDAYIDYHHAGALLLISTIVDRKAVMELKQGRIFPNIWSMLLGLSSVARKSTIIGQVHNFDFLLAKSYRRELPKQFTPEAFIEVMDEKSHAYYVNDECADLLKGLNKKTYMSDLRDAFCTIYDNIGFSRQLRTSKSKEKKTNFAIKEPYMTALFATTPGNIERFTEYDDMSSGWMIRFLYYYPNYKKGFMSLTKKSSNDTNKFNEIANKLTKLNTFFETITSPIEFYFVKEAEEFFNKWNEEIENNPTNDDIMRSGISRLIVYALKLSMLYEIADDEFIENYTKSNKNDINTNYDTLNSYPISLEKITEACNEITNYFIPMLERAKILVESGDDKNAQIKVINTLKRHNGKLKRGKLAELTRLSRKDLDEALKVLSEDTEEVKIVLVSTKTKPQEWICLNNNHS